VRGWLLRAMSHTMRITGRTTRAEVNCWLVSSTRLQVRHYRLHMSDISEPKFDFFASSVSEVPVRIATAGTANVNPVHYSLSTNV